MSYEILLIKCGIDQKTVPSVINKYIKFQFRIPLYLIHLIFLSLLKKIYFDNLLVDLLDVI